MKRVVISRVDASALARAPLPIAHYIPGKSWAGTLIKDHTGQGFDRSGASLAGMDETEFYHFDQDERVL